MPIHAALDEAEIRALEYALDDEYKSHETYAQVIRDFGDVRPFINIVEAEARHSAALLSLFERYGVAPPANRWVGNAPRFDSVHAACVAAVQGEIDNVKLFKRVLESTRRPDILAVYEALQTASQSRHLPAFQRCADRGGGGRGRNRRC